MELVGFLHPARLHRVHPRERVRRSFWSRASTPVQYHPPPSFQTIVLPFLALTLGTPGSSLPIIPKSQLAPARTTRRLDLFAGQILRREHGNHSSQQNSTGWRNWERKCLVFFFGGLFCCACIMSLSDTILPHHVRSPLMTLLTVAVLVFYTYIWLFSSRARGERGGLYGLSIFESMVYDKHQPCDSGMHLACWIWEEKWKGRRR